MLCLYGIGVLLQDFDDAVDVIGHHDEFVEAGVRVVMRDFMPEHMCDGANGGEVHFFGLDVSEVVAHVLGADGDKIQRWPTVVPGRPSGRGDAVFV
ncbi:hypothetical protein [Persicobacter diffluens]|uniref:hypothetical protein n=1 Tax=Persicobacter diffluens TaxID=981 RepID=UPI0030C73681